MGAFLRRLGYRVEYVSEFGVHDCRYDATDYAMGRPIHPDMSVAPPWAKRHIVRQPLATMGDQNDD